MEVHQYWPLVEIKCSSDLKFFICSLYVPICMEDFTGTVPVCRSVCERAKYGCEPVMYNNYFYRIPALFVRRKSIRGYFDFSHRIQYGFQWPERMKCDRFPEYGTKKALCMDEKLGELPPKEPRIIPNVGVIGKGYPKGSSRGGLRPGITSISSQSNSEVLQGRARNNCSCKACHHPLVRITGKDAFNHSGILIESNGIQDCGIPCNLFKAPEEIQFTKYWLLAWSSICAFVTFLTLLTFIIDPVR